MYGIFVRRLPSNLSYWQRYLHHGQPAAILPELKRKLRDGHTPQIHDFEGGIRECLENGDLQQVIRYYTNMRVQFGLEPTSKIYESVIKSYARMGQPMVALEVFRGVQKQNLAEPATYSIMVEALADSGQFRRGREVLEEMKDQDLKVDESVYCALIQSYSRGNDWRSAFELYEQACESSESDAVHNAMIFVLAASSNPSSERAKASIKVLQHLKEKGIKPSPHLYKEAVLLLQRAHEIKLAQEIQVEFDKMNQ